MLCEDFEQRLSDYLDGLLDGETHRLFAGHALRCPVCHETLSLVKNTVQACHTADVPPPSAQLETRILNSTMPETAMSCEEFEQFLTDYLDGFLPASLFHRWERHAAHCEQCTELPGQVVRTIGACYTYKSEELLVPQGLNERILQATLGTAVTREVRAPLTARLATRLRFWLDPIMSPQLATVATMLLVAVFVLTNMVSADGSIRGMYQESLRLAGQGFADSKDVSGPGIQQGVKEFFVGDENPKSPTSNTPEQVRPEESLTPKKDSAEQKQKGASKPKAQNNH
jgi:anti-sigma factor RsiW